MWAWHDAVPARYVVGMEEASQRLEHCSAAVDTPTVPWNASIGSLWRKRTEPQRVSWA